MAMRMLMLLRVVSVVLAATPSSMLAGASAPRGRLAPARAQAILQGVADEISARYNCSVAAAFQSRHAAVAVASGFTDAGLGMGTKTRRGLPADPYVWGSITKMFTGPAVLQLVERGVMRLDDPIGLHVDPLLQQLNGTTLADHFGPDINDVQVHHLLHMTSGVKDYDGEKYARDQFHNRTRDFSPLDIIGHYVEPGRDFAPGTNQDYCSANYILLGLALAYHYDRPASWAGYDQRTVIPAGLRQAFNHSAFVNTGTCADHTPVHGFMQSYSTAALPPQDVWNISCTGGWTAGNYVGSVGDVARYTYDLYNTKAPTIVSPASLRHMLNFTAPIPFKFYGMGTFSLDWSVGDAEAYGHVGDTYGYQSQTTYFPGADFVFTVATNVETTNQAQPADATCTAYHRLVAAMEGKAPPTCTFTVPNRFIGTCNCTYPHP